MLVRLHREVNRVFQGQRGWLMVGRVHESEGNLGSWAKPHSPSGPLLVNLEKADPQRRPSLRISVQVREPSDVAGSQVLD